MGRNKNSFVGSEVLTAVIMKSSVFPDTTPCSPLKLNRLHNIVTYRPTARQRLGKHILVEAYERNNRTSTARQRISKQVFNRQAVFSAWFVLMGYKRPKKVVRVSCCRELGRVLEVAVEGD
jgi:hypothetical protein